MSATVWAQECRLTCLGGSEVGECNCRRPQDCKMQEHPEFLAKRTEAVQRMLRVIFSPRVDVLKPLCKEPRR